MRTLISCAFLLTSFFLFQIKLFIHYTEKFDILYIMFKIIILAIVCCAIVNGNLKDNIQDTATEALNQGEKLKV
jgi:hypothetical protein